MAVKVLIVDDSSFFRRRVSEILSQDPQIEIIDSAVNGKEAVEKAAALRPDVITMDIEMPVLDGISAVKQIMQSTPTAILMFSSLTRDGAKATLDALDAGALDFLPKKFEDIARNSDEATLTLQQKVKELGRRRVSRIVRPMASPSPRPTASPASTSSISSSRTALSQPDRSFSRSSMANSQPQAGTNSASANSVSNGAAASSRNFQASGKRYKLVVIGTSTGGPVALQTILTQLPANFPHPILLVQHMPAAFTPAFAQRLNGVCKIQVKEAQQGDRLQAGTAYIAPGGQQMLLDGRSNLKVFVDDNPRTTYKPSVDVTFASSAKQFGGDVLALVLTGMGADGREGARLLKQVGSRIWTQDEKSCVVYGMPQAVFNAGLSEQQVALQDVASFLCKEVGCG